MLTLFRSSPFSAPGAVGVGLVACETRQKPLITLSAYWPLERKRSLGAWDWADLLLQARQQVT